MARQLSGPGTVGGSKYVGPAPRETLNGHRAYTDETRRSLRAVVRQRGGAPRNHSTYPVQSRRTSNPCTLVPFAKVGLSQTIANVTTQQGTAQKRCSYACTVYAASRSTGVPASAAPAASFLWSCCPRQCSPSYPTVCVARDSRRRIEDLLRPRSHRLSPRIEDTL